MDYNMFNNGAQFLLYNKYHKLLSPFGQKVMSTIINLKKENENSFNNRQPSYNRSKATLPFTPNIPKIPSPININSSNKNCLDNNEPNIQTKMDDMPLATSSIGLLKTIHQDTNPAYAVATTGNMINSGNNIVHVLSQSIPRKLNDEVNAIGSEVHEANLDLSWSNLYDSEIFENSDDDNNNAIKKNQKVTSDELILGQKFNNSDEENFPKFGDCNKVKDGNKKRKNVITQAGSSKKAKTVEVNKNKPRNMFRKEKYPIAVKKWLSDVDPGNVVEEESVEFLKAVENNESYKTIQQTNMTITSSGDTNMNVGSVVIKKNKKKTIQAQLANKGGIMKFKKPQDLNIPMLSEANTPADNTNNVEKDIQKKSTTNKTKEKKIAKYMPPIKSQTPVKDITYTVNIVNDNNLDKNKHNLTMINSSEIVIILMYKNGFNQLNSQYTEDSCVPEGILLNVFDTFYYIRGKIDGITECLHSIMTKNVAICYDAKVLMIYLLGQLGLPLRGFDVMDVKIGGSLLSPDKIPESFSETQKLLEFSPEHTIATDCTLQKACWYITLLRDCYGRLKSSLLQDALWNVFIDIEMKILPLVSEMEHRGVMVDVEKLKAMEAVLEGRMRATEAVCHRAAGRSFQLNSAAQVRSLLYDELQLDTKSNVKIRETIGRGAKSTAETMLRSLTTDHPLPKLILEYRRLHKAHATFLSGIAQHVRGGLVTPTWEQTAAATGRIASSNPNLQAIPKTPFDLVLFPTQHGSGAGEGEGSGRQTLTLNFRSIYTARPGHVLLAVDFKHVECRVFAHAAADATLLRALTSPDLFRVLAAEWLNKHESEVTSEERERTKRIVYASLYGAGTRSLTEKLDLPYDQALSIITSFNRTYPCLKSFARSVVSQCESENCRLRTPSGRARTFANIASTNFADKSHAERQAVNFIIQGTAADLCKMAMIASCERMRACRPPPQCHLLLQIHDELVWEVLHQDLERAAGIAADLCKMAMIASYERGRSCRPPPQRHLLLQIHDELEWKVLHQDLERAAVVIKDAMESCGRSCGIERLPVAVRRGATWGHMEEFTPVASTHLI